MLHLFDLWLHNQSNLIKERRRPRRLAALGRQTNLSFYEAAHSWPKSTIFSQPRRVPFLASLQVFLILFRVIFVKNSMLIQIYKLILFHATFLSQITFLFSHVLTIFLAIFQVSGPECDCRSLSRRHTINITDGIQTF